MKHILIADDNPTIRKLLAEILRANGYATSEASDGAEALQLLEKTRVDAIISDILMPIMDGYMFCYEVRKSRKHSTLPFIFLTAIYTSTSDEQHALDLGADRILRKPFCSKEVLNALHEMFSNPLYRKPRAIAPIRETEFIKQYANRLMPKLEEKIIELHERTEELKKLSIALEQTADSIVITNKEGVIEYVNPAFEQHTGYTKEFAIGKTPAILKSGKHDAAFYEKLWKTILSGKVFREEFVNRKSNGEFFYEQQTISPVLDTEGKVVHFVSAGRDVTERKQTEETLRESEQRFRSLFENMLEGYAYCKILFDNDEAQDFLYIEVNNAFEKLTGLKNVAGKKVSEVIPGIKEANPELFEIYGRVALTGKPEKFETHIKSLGIWFSIAVYSPVKEYFIAVFDNITERKQAEAALHAEDAKFRGLVEQSLVGVYIIQDGKMIYVNPKLAEIFGYTPEEIVALRIPFDLAAEEDHARMAENFRKRLAGEVKSLNYTFHGLRKDGSLINVEVFGTVTEVGGRPAIVGTLLDITERKHAEEALQRAEEKYRGIFENAVVGIYQTTLDGDFLMANPTLARSLGYESPQELIEVMNVLDHQFYIEPTRRREFVRLIEEQGTVIGFESQARRKDGRVIWISETGRAVRDDSGKLIGFEGTTIDINDRKQAEHAMRESEERFRLIAENVADLIAVLDVNGKRIYSSPSYKNILADPKVLLGTDSFEDIHPDDRDRMRLVFSDTVRTGTGQRSEFRFLKKDGSVIHIESQGSTIRDEQGKVSKVLVVSRDVTEKKKLEAQYLRAQRMESIGTLAGGIAHDLNNVLAPIVMGIGMLKSKVTDEGSQKILRTLETSAQRGAGMVKQVLTFARGISGERVVLQVGHLILEMQKIVSQTFPKSIQFSAEVPRDLWPVSSDATQIHQVLLNLCVNARDAMPGGGFLTITAENTVTDENFALMNVEAKAGPYVVLTVIDTGTGIPQDLLDKVFDPFFTTKEIGKGTGLGLSTVHSIVKSHGGFINVYSEVGRGTKFRVYLPAETSAEEKQVKVEQAELPSGHGELILLVDDEVSIRDICRTTLESYGYNVLTAADGTEAVVQYMQRTNDIQLVITDMMMPFMDGRATILALCKINPEVKIIVTSGFMAEEKSIDRRDLSICAFLSKPYSAAKLLTTVAGALAGVEKL